MSLDNTYTYKIAVSVDVLTASIFWNRTDLTVSSLCGLELRKVAAGKGGVWSLVQLGRFLNRLSKDHCESAIRGDAQAALNTLNTLGVRYTLEH